MNIACEFAVKQEPFVNMWATAAQRLYNDIEIGRDVNHLKGGIENIIYTVRIRWLYRSRIVGLPTDSVLY